MDSTETTDVSWKSPTEPSDIIGLRFASIEVGHEKGSSIHVQTDDGAWHWGRLLPEHAVECVSSLLAASLHMDNGTLNTTLGRVTDWLDIVKEELRKRQAANDAA